VAVTTLVRRTSFLKIVVPAMVRKRRVGLENTDKARK